MKRRALLSLIMLWTAVAAAPAEYAAGMTTADFLRIRLDARIAALGGAGVATVSGPSSFQFNPAGLAAMRSPNRQMAFNHVEYPAHIRLSNTAFAAGTTGVDFTALYVADDRRDLLGNELGTFLNYNAAFTGGYAFRHDFGLLVGLAGRFVRMEYDGQGSGSLCFDVGAQYRMAVFTAAAAIRNLGWGVDLGGAFAQMPIEMLVGGAVHRGGFTFALEADLPANGRKSFHLGTEYSIGVAAIRAGYVFRESGNELGGADGLTVGGGMSWRGFSLDYAYVPFGYFATIHRVSLSIGF